MSQIVFILGAGASREAGGPLMATFLDTARQVLDRGRAGHDEPSFKLVFQGIGALQSVHSKADLDIVNIESVFDAFEMATTLEKLGSIEDVTTLVPAMRDLIVRTLEQTIHVHRNESGICPDKAHHKFVDLLGRLQQRQPVSVITFNYDIALDFALHFGGQAFSYALDGDARPADIRLLKLHGSVNWTQCVKCEGVWDIPVADLSRGVRVPNGEMQTVIPVSDVLRSTRKCSCGAQYQTLIVPPSWSKATYREPIARVWRAAASELNTAEYIIPIGYSLPESDAFFRQLYALGSVGDQPLKGFWVVNPDRDGLVEGRFRALLGPGARQRFQMIQRPFLQCSKKIANLLNLD